MCKYKKHVIDYLILGITYFVITVIVAFIIRTLV